MFEATARLKIREGGLEGFERQAAEMMRRARALDEGPLRYDWFLRDDGAECEVREAYVDADALLAHQRRIAEAKSKLFHGFVESHSMTFYGEPSPALAGALEAMAVPFTRFSFLQGLDGGPSPESVLRRERPAFEVTARLGIREGELEGFVRQAAEMMRLTREHDAHTLRYDWFLSDDGARCEVREAYVDPDGLLEHAHNVNEAREKLFRDHAYGHDMTIYGEPSPALAALIERLAGHVTFTRYSLLQGLDHDVRGLQEKVGGGR